MGQPVVHFEVVGRDGAKLQSYYSDLFEWEVQQVPGVMHYGLIERHVNDDGIGVAGGIGGMDGIEGMEGEQGHATFYVEVPDIRASIAKAESLGGKCQMGPHEVPGQGIEVALVADPEGLVTGMVSTKS